MLDIYSGLFFILYTFHIFLKKLNIISSCGTYLLF